MLVVLGILLTAQSVAADVIRVQRVSERLHYLHPVLSCDRTIERWQTRLFDRRFAKRIAELKRKDVNLNGADPGFEAIALGRCSRSTAGFNEALREFGIHLTAIEREFRQVR